MARDLESAEELLDEFAEAWGKNDGKQLGDHFSSDGTLINPFGQRADGREAVAAMYSEYFAGMLAGTSSTMRMESARPVGEDSAFVDAEQTITAADGSVVLTVHLAALLQRGDEGWRFVDSRPYAFAAAPA